VGPVKWHYLGTKCPSNTKKTEIVIMDYSQSGGHAAEISVCLGKKFAFQFETEIPKLHINQAFKIQQ
jgi:hypothetical protein